MNSNRTSLEQDVIDYVNAAQDIHEKALAFLVAMAEIRIAVKDLERSSYKKTPQTHTTIA